MTQSTPQDNSKPVLLTGEDAEKFNKQHEESLSRLQGESAPAGCIISRLKDTWAKFKLKHHPFRMGDDEHDAFDEFKKTLQEFFATPSHSAPVSEVGEAEDFLKASFDKHVKSKISMDFYEAKGENGYDWVYEAMENYANKKLELSGFAAASNGEAMQRELWSEAKVEGQKQVIRNRGRQSDTDIITNFIALLSEQYLIYKK